MRFFDREQELDFLKAVDGESESHARMTILKGRRRVGKTALLRQAYGAGDFLYFFVARKNEADLCIDFQAEISRYFGISMLGAVGRFEDVFKFLMEMSVQRHFTLVIDEFQEFLRVNPSIFSAMQRDWDRLKDRSKMNLIVSGSINKMMEQIFSADQPLYGRATNEFTLDPFTTSTLKEILSECGGGLDAESLLALWTFTGGVAKYVELLMDGRAYGVVDMVANFISESSTIPNEGKVLLVDEFGKDYGTYFSILSLIASGRTSRSEIQNVIGSDVGGYLVKLVDEYRLVSKKVPFGAETSVRNTLYTIEDNFLRFWFRFVYKYQSAIELRAYERLRDFVLRDYKVFSGIALEGYFRRKMAEAGCWTKIGGWWDRKGQNEIDIIAVDEFDKRIRFCEVKRNPEKINPAALEERVQSFFVTEPRYSEFQRELCSLSMDDL